MPIPNITALPPPPLRSQNPATFTTTAENFVDALGDFVTETNAAIDEINALSFSTNSWKGAVRVATTAAITLASGLEAGDTIDGVTLATGDRVLVKNQAAASENGVYVVAASGAPSRAADMNASDEVLGAVVFVIAGTANGGKIFYSTNTSAVTIGSSSLTFAQFTGGAAVGGTFMIPVLASAMVTRTTNGAPSGSSETATNRIMVETKDFDQSTDEFVQFSIPMPESWNEGTVTAKFVWTAAATGNVVWGIQGVAISDDDPLEAAFGTAQTVTDGVTAANDLMISAATAAVTIAGTPAAGDLVIFQIYRDADNGSDTLAADAKLLAVRLYFTTNAADDS